MVGRRWFSTFAQQERFVWVSLHQLRRFGTGEPFMVLKKRAVASERIVDFEIVSTVRHKNFL